MYWVCFQVNIFYITERRLNPILDTNTRYFTFCWTPAQCAQGWKKPNFDYPQRAMGMCYSETRYQMWINKKNSLKVDFLTFYGKLKLVDFRETRQTQLFWVKGQIWEEKYWIFKSNSGFLPHSIHQLFSSFQHIRTTF